MKMKKCLALLLSLVMLFSITACQIGQREEHEYFLVEDFEGKPVGILEDSGLEASVKDRIPGAKIKKYASIDKAVSALKDYKVETLVVSGSVADYIINEDESLAKILQVYTDNQMVVASTTLGNTAEDEFRSNIDATMSRIKGNGTYYQLLEKYIFNEAPSVEDANIEFNESKINRELHIGVCADSAPFSYKNESGQWAGFDIEIANAIATYYGATPIFKEYTKDELIPALNAEEIRVAFGQFTAKESEEWIHPVYPSIYFDNSVYLVSNKVDVGENPFTSDYLS